MRYSENFQGLFSCQTQELAYFWKVNVVIGSSGYLNQRLAAKGESDWLLPYYSLFR